MYRLTDHYSMMIFIFFPIQRPLYSKNVLTFVIYIPPLYTTSILIQKKTRFMHASYTHSLQSVSLQKDNVALQHNRVRSQFYLTRIYFLESFDFIYFCFIS